MKFLIDANLSPSVGVALSDAGFESIHAGDVGLLRASDEAIFDWAVENEMAVVTADSDFGMLLAFSRSTSPSVVQLRDVAEQRWPLHVYLLLAALPSVTEALEEGAVVTINPDRVRVRQLPIER